MTVSEVVSYLRPLSVTAGAEAPSIFARNPDRETLGEFIRRVSDELLWPRILVRTAPPQGEVLANAPVRH